MLADASLSHVYVRLTDLPENVSISNLRIHDEHEDKQITLRLGVYTFAFLDGYEDEW